MALALPRVAGAWARVVVVLAAVVGIDQGTKALVKSSIEPGERNNVFFGIDLVHTQNDGVAFGFLSGGGAPVILLTAAALAAILVYFARRPTRPWAWLPTGLLLGGAIGNVLDRAIEGSVTDFIDLPLWPPFNCADMAITIGVVLLLLVIESSSRDRADRA